MIDLVATQPHYFEHLLPVFERLPDEERGVMYLGPAAEPLLPMSMDVTVRNVLDMNQGHGPVLAGGFDDLRMVHRRPVILMEHGCGQGYAGDPAAAVNPAYAGGQGRHGVMAFLHPNEQAAARDRAAYPDAIVEVVGSPHLASLQALQRPPAPKGKPTVAFTWHWDCNLTLESMSAWRHYVGAFDDAARSDDYETVLGHAHPRAYRDMAPHFEAVGAEPVATFQEILTRAHVLVADNTSALYEFAALRGPVVVLDAPWYRRDIEHGLRFWDAANVGPRISDPAGLPAAIEAALETRPWPEADEILAQIFPPIADPAQVAADAAVRAAHSPQAQEALTRAASPFPRSAPLPRL